MGGSSAPRKHRAGGAAAVWPGRLPSFIIGELACGNLRNRAEILAHLQALPMAIPAGPDEVLQFIKNYRLMGKGLGYVDLHLLASARLTKFPLWTLD